MSVEAGNQEEQGEVDLEQTTSEDEQAETMSVESDTDASDAETGEEGDESATIDAFREEILQHVYGGGRHGNRYMSTEAVQELFRRLAASEVPGMAKAMEKEAATAALEKKLSAQVKKLEADTEQQKRVENLYLQAQKALEKLAEDKQAGEAKLREDLAAINATRQEILKSTQGEATSKVLEEAERKVASTERDIAKTVPTKPSQRSWAEMLRGGSSQGGRLPLRNSPPAAMQNQPRSMSTEQREEAALEYEIPDWAEGQPLITLAISGITGGSSRPVGAVRSFLQSRVGPELRLMWIERATEATVELLVPRGSWAVTCKYLADNGVHIHPELEPMSPRPGGAATPERAHKEAVERWTQWAKGDPSKPFTRLGKALMQKYPQLAEEASQPEPRRFAQSTASEPGEIADPSLPAPEAGWSNATLKTRSKSAEPTAESNKQKRARTPGLPSTNSFALLSDDEEMAIDDLRQAGQSGEEGPQKGPSHCNQ
ncbi:hypothetical protein FB645_002664 [Coemansia sp. IMI 203386]|nr:hypothetical protein FB645_002664 [Coemansia sp. IMI 203386]